MHKAAITVTAALLGSANAFWRMECPGRVALGRVDPIVSPGKLSTHAHTVHGSSAFSETADTSVLLDGNCTSCRVTQDKSAYWTPPLYFKDASTGQYELVNQVGGMLAYYLLYGDTVTAFPTGFQMIAGDTYRRNYTVGDPSQPDPDKSSWAALGQTTQADLAQRAIGFNCLNYNIAPEGTLYRHYLPDKDYLDAHCTDGIRFELMFPSCWKGGDAVDSPNHKDHMAYPDLVMTGDCPADYPERVPSMLFEIIWDTYAFKDRQGEFVIANGDTTGFGFHGDFMMGWDEGFLQSAVNTCTNPSGLIEDCPLFDVVDQGTATSCTADLPAAVLADNLKGPAVELPGNVQITYANSGSDAGNPAPGSSSSSTAPALTYKPGDKPTDSAQPLPGQVFKETSAVSAPIAPIATTSAVALGAEAISSTSTSTTSTSSTTSTTSSTSTTSTTSTTTSSSTTTSTTTIPPTTSAPAPTESFWSTQYITAGAVVSKIYWEQAVVTVTEEIDATTTIITGPSSPPKAKRHLAHHHHHHGY